jgi:hypothetical protein
MSDLFDRIFIVAKRCDVEYKTMWQWKNRGFVPAANHFPLMKKAKEIDIPLSYEELHGLIVDAKSK